MLFWNNLDQANIFKLHTKTHKNETILYCNVTIYFTPLQKLYNYLNYDTVSTYT